MKRVVTVAAFIIAYAVLLSLCIVCFLNLLGIAMAISLDGRSAASQFPRFIPFCLAAGFLSVIMIIALCLFNFKIAEKLSYSRITWIIQSAAAFVCSLPVIKLWDMLFRYFQQRF